MFGYMYLFLGDAVEDRPAVEPRKFVGYRSSLKFTFLQIMPTTRRLGHPGFHSRVSPGCTGSKSLKMCGPAAPACRSSLHVLWVGTSGVVAGVGIYAQVVTAT